MNRADLEAKTVPVLKDELEGLKLPTDGLKADLVNRLVAYYEAEAVKTAETATAETAGESSGAPESTEAPAGDKAPESTEAPTPPADEAAASPAPPATDAPSAPPAPPADEAAPEAPADEAAPAPVIPTNAVANDGAEAPADPVVEDKGPVHYKYVPLSGQSLNAFGGVPAEGRTFTERQPRYDAFVGVYFTLEEVPAEGNEAAE